MVFSLFYGVRKFYIRQSKSRTFGLLCYENKNPQPMTGEVGEAIRSSRPPPPFHESVLETTATGDLTHSSDWFSVTDYWKLLTDHWHLQLRDSAGITPASPLLVVLSY